MQASNYNLTWQIYNHFFGDALTKVVQGMINGLIFCPVSVEWLFRLCISVHASLYGQLLMYANVI